MAKKRVGILTGGGDVPGLNSVIKSVVYRGSELGCEVIGIRRGWEGLTPRRFWRFVEDKPKISAVCFCCRMASPCFGLVMSF